MLVLYIDAPARSISGIRPLMRDAYKSITGMSQKQVMPIAKSEYLSMSLEITLIWTFHTEFPTILNKSCTYITKSAVKN